jgi:hypothetical protein
LPKKERRLGTLGAVLAPQRQGSILARTANRPEDDMTIAELIFEQVKNLPDQAAREVLDFIGYIRDRRERTEWRDLMDAQSASLAPIWDNAEDQVWDNV